MSNRHHSAEMPYDLDLDEHDEPQSRGSRPSRNGRKAPDDFLYGDGGGGRNRRSSPRRDGAREERKRMGRRDEGNTGGLTAGNSRPPLPPRDRDRPAPYGSRATGSAGEPHNSYREHPPPRTPERRWFPVCRNAGP